MGTDTADELAVEGLTFSYVARDAAVIDHLTMQFERGAVTALTGPSGRGKSTLLYLCGLLLRPSQGLVLLGRSPVSSFSDAQRSRIRAEKIGFVFQDASLNPSVSILKSVIEPALYAGKSSKEMRTRAHSLLERLGVSHRVDHRPGEISGGQAQRVAMCRAMINEPTLILADEPTGNLDSASGAQVLDVLQEWAALGNTVLIATHDDQVSRNADVRLRLE